MKVRKLMVMFLELGGGRAVRKEKGKACPVMEVFWVLGPEGFKAVDFRGSPKGRS